MQKRFNMLVLIVLLVFQAMLAPVAATAQGEKQEVRNTETSEDLGSGDDTDGSEKNEGSGNEAAKDVVDVEAAEESTSGDKNDDDTNGNTPNTTEEDAEAGKDDEDTEEEPETVELEKSITEEREENKEVTDENEEESSLTTPGLEVYQAKDLGNIFTFESLTLNDEEINDGDVIDLSNNSKIQGHYSWHTENLNAKAGDTASLVLPSIFKQVNIQNQPIITSDIEVGTYNIMDGKLGFIFNEKIEGNDVRNGYVTLNLEFDLEKFKENVEQEIKFNDQADKTLKVIAKPTKEIASIKKEGHPDKWQDAKEINWSIDIINDNDEPIFDAVLKDTLPEGLGDPRDFVVQEISVGMNGSKNLGSVMEVTPSVSDNGFELRFDEISPYNGYRVEYKTTIEDITINNFTNHALFRFGETELPAEATVYTGNRSNQIEKKGHYQQNTGQIEWEIIINQSGGEIDEAIIYDTLPDELIFVADSLEVHKFNDHWNWLEKVHIDPNEFPIKLGKVEANEIYQIKFKTDIDWSKVNDGEYKRYHSFTNETELKDGEEPRGEDDATVDIWRENILSKSGNASEYSYDHKVLTWTIHVNKAKHPISNAVLTDILPAGLDINEDDIHITGEDNKPFSAESITITPLDDGRTELKVDLGNIGTKALQVTYQTKVEDFKKNSFKNEVRLEGDGVGEDTPQDDVTVYPPGNSYTKDFKGIDYREKTMDWSIAVNPHREGITALEIKDTFPNNGMILLPHSVVVKIGDTELGEGTDYTIKPNKIDGKRGYHKGFTINFTHINEATPLNERLTVDFTTSYDPQLEIDGNTPDEHTGDPTLYINKANFTGKTVNGHDIDEEDDAETNVRKDAWNSGKKEGQIVHEDAEGNLVNGWESGFERKIAWQLYTNYQKQNLGAGVVITDTLDYEGTIDKGSFTVSVYEVDKEGNTKITEPEITDYAIDVDGKEFTLTFSDGFVVDERYVIQFTTTVPDISQPNYTNHAIVKVGDKEYPYSGTVNYDKHDNLLDKKALELSKNHVYTGDLVEWEIKINEGLSVIKEANIVDTISKGLVYVDNSLEIVRLEGTKEVSLVQGEDYILDVQFDGESEETALTISFTDNLEHILRLNYTTVVTEIDGPVNNKVHFSGTGIEKVSRETERLNARQFSDIGGEFNQSRGAIRVNKVDENDEIIETGEATFYLYYELNGERIQFVQEDAFVTKDGVLEIGNLPLRTYYLQEVKAPDGYIISDKEMKIDVTESLKNHGPYEVDFKNIAEVEITVSKIWKDTGNQDGIRPDSITAKLLANGKEIGREVELNEENNWQSDFTDLDVKKDGEAIVYTVEEDAVEGYEISITGSAEEGFVITNSYEPELIDLAGTKTWDDTDNQDGKRPDSITVRLLANGEEVESVEVTVETDWTFEFSNLPKFKNGEEINYSVQEDSVEDYSTTVDSFDITNRYTPEKTSINVVKVWDDAGDQDGLRPDSITVKLLANGEETGQEVELNANNNWQADFTDLDVNKAGEPIVYTVGEEQVPGYDQPIISGTAEDGFVITNTHELELINIEGTKIWEDTDDQDGKRASEIIVRLFAGETEVASKEVTADDDWTFEFTDLPKFENGEEITYTIQEDAVEGYSTEIDGFNITNSYTPEVTEVSGTKTWVDAGNQDGKRPTEITVKLLADGEETDATEVTAADDWKYAFDNLPKYADGKEIKYTIAEVTVEGYETTINGFNIANSYTPEKTSINLVKSWDDANNQDGIRPDFITVKLLADGEETGEEVELNEENNWQADITELDVYANGEEIVYTVEEVAVEGYETSIAGTPEDGFEITNSYEPELINIEGTKTWDDVDDQDGKRPDKVTVRLLANGIETESVEVTANHNWKYEFTNLPKYENGTEITYIVQEDNVEDYSTEIDGFNITNRYTPGKTSINVVKIWEDKDGKDKLRPDEITVKLLANGEETGQEQTLNGDNNWQADFTDLDINKAGEVIVYTVEEVEVDGYSTEITGDAKEGFVITNTQKTYAIGDYTWIDSNKDGIQDEDEEVLPGVKVELLDEDGKKIAETETDENGRYIFDELPAGKYKVKFTLTEEQAKKYKFTKQNAGDESMVDSDADEDGRTVVFTLGDENIHLTKDYTDQAFKATEGIDPTWDAGVIEITPEEPEEPREPSDPEELQDPEDPQEPSDPEDPEAPEDPEKPTPGEDPKDPKVEKPEGELPKTATNIYSLILIGFGFMLLGAILFVVRRKRTE